jgi:succinoglycan biosynthesis transport protein ExoP
MSDAGRHDLGALRDHARVLKRRKWLALVTALALPAAAVALSLQQKPLYEASAQVLLRYQTLASSLSGIEDPSIWQDPNRLAATQTELARVPELASRVLEATRLRDRSAKDFLAASSVSARSDVDLLEFKVKDSDPGLSARLATEYAREFTKYRTELRTESLRRAREGLRERIDELLAGGRRRSNSGYARSLINKEEQLRTMEELESSNALLLRPASNATQIQPRPVRSGLIGLGLGLVLGIGLAFLAEALDTRVRSAEAIGERLGLQLLGRLPVPPRRLRKENRLVMLDEPNGAHAESFRVLRTNLDFVNLERGARTIMVTSALQQEGKSTTVANLGIALARSGRRVALVDLDLRRPILARLFGLEGWPGITEVALGNVALEDAIAEVAIGEANGAEEASSDGRHRGELGGALWVLTSGPIPPDPGEFAGTRALTEILRDLREWADLVLIDTPPILQVGDAMALSAQVDALIVVARLSIIRRPTLGELRRVLDTCPAAKLGFVLAGAELEEGYGYEGYYRYYRSYRPSEREATREPRPQIGSPR